MKTFIFLIILNTCSVISFAQTVELDSPLGRQLSTFLIQNDDLTPDDKFSIFSQLIVKSEDFTFHKFGIKGFHEHEYVFFKDTNGITIIKDYRYEALLYFLEMKFNTYKIAEKEKAKITIEMLTFLLSRIDNEESMEIHVIEK